MVPSVLEYFPPILLVTSFPYSHKHRPVPFLVLRSLFDFDCVLNINPISKDTPGFSRAMDFTLRCNSLKCRTQLTETAVVTTCRSVDGQSPSHHTHADTAISHVFCDQCTDTLGLSAPAGKNRLCPACQTTLPEPDDAARTFLQPSEDYKTSVLSGLNPSTIMECAARGLAFWSYQSTQEMYVGK